MDLTGKKVAVLVEDLYQDLEVWYPLYRLREAGVTAFTVGSGSKNMYVSRHGYQCPADKSINEINVDEIDGIVIPGGYAPDILRRYPEVNQLVQDAGHQGKIIASICHGAWVLCSTDLLKGRSITCFFAIKDDVINAGATYVDQEVCVDGNIISSRKPDDLPAFMRETLKALSK